MTSSAVLSLALDVHGVAVFTPTPVLLAFGAAAVLPTAGSAPF